MDTELEVTKVDIQVHFRYSVNFQQNYMTVMKWSVSRSTLNKYEMAVLVKLWNVHFTHKYSDINERYINAWSFSIERSSDEEATPQNLEKWDIYSFWRLLLPNYYSLIYNNCIAKIPIGTSLSIKVLISRNATVVTSA